MVATSWHAATLRQLSSAVAVDPAVAEAWVYGSTADAEFDEWSDLDVALVVPADEVLRVASPAWVSVVGPVWTYHTSARDRGSGVRVVLRDGRVVELIAVTHRDAVPAPRRLLADLLAGDAEPAGGESGPSGQPVTGATTLTPHGVPDLPPLVHEFRSTAAQAVRRYARGDLLAAGHLALELPRQCLVAATLLRERDVHGEQAGVDDRPGTRWDGTLDRVFDLIPEVDAGNDGVLDLVDAAAGLFDELAAELWSSYVPDWSGLTALLDRARRH
jgi:hypothetical protein